MPKTTKTTKTKAKPATTAPAPSTPELHSLVTPPQDDRRGTLVGYWSRREDLLKLSHMTFVVSNQRSRYAVTTGGTYGNDLRIAVAFSDGKHASLRDYEARIEKSRNRDDYFVTLNRTNPRFQAYTPSLVLMFHSPTLPEAFADLCRMFERAVLEQRGLT